jgi:hypothetical protein
MLRRMEERQADPLDDARLEVRIADLVLDDRRTLNRAGRPTLRPMMIRPWRSRSRRKSSS